MMSILHFITIPGQWLLGLFLGLYWYFSFRNKYVGSDFINDWIEHCKQFPDMVQDFVDSHEIHFYMISFFGSSLIYWIVLKIIFACL